MRPRTHAYCVSDSLCISCRHHQTRAPLQQISAFLAVGICRQVGIQVGQASLSHAHGGRSIAQNLIAFGRDSVRFRSLISPRAS